MKNNFAADKLAPVLEDLGIHFESNDTTIQRKSLETDSLTIDTADENCVIAKISSINVDRTGDILIPNGCDTTEYEKNAVIFTNHNYAQLPIAKMIKIQKTSTAVYGKYQFSETPEAQAVLKLVKEGILKANSVGFIALETLKRGSAAFTKYVNDHFNGVVDKTVKQIITRWQLLENSLVGIGCNKDALVLAISKGLITNPIVEIIKQEYIDKPYPNEHAVRLENPDKYVKFARKNDEMGSGIDAIYGITSDGKTELQAIRFDSSKYTIEDVTKWIKDHDMTPISIEEASGKIEEKTLETPVEPQPVVVEPTISEQVEHIVEDVKDVIEDVEKVVEAVIEEVKPTIERFIRLVSKPEEEVKKELMDNLNKKRLGKLF